MKTIRLPTIK